MKMMCFCSPLTDTYNSYYSGNFYCSCYLITDSIIGCYIDNLLLLMMLMMITLLLSLLLLLLVVVVMMIKFSVLLVFTIIIIIVVMSSYLGVIVTVLCV